jgi:hypothetical protein
LEQGISAWLFELIQSGQIKAPVANAAASMMMAIA